MTMLNLKHLYYYHIFAQELSTTKAALRLRISSPALSNQLKELEAYLGFKLTKRSQGKLAITELGKVVVHYTDRMFSAYDELKVKIASASPFTENNFRAGISQNLGSRFSFDLLALISKSQLSLSQKTYITFDSSDKIISGFKNEQFDLIIGSFEPEPKSNSAWVYQNLSFPVRLFAPLKLMDTLDKKDRKLSETDLNLMIGHANAKELSVVLPAKGSVLRFETDHFLEKLKVLPTKTIECNNSSAIVELIERGFAIGFVPTPCLLDFKLGKFLNVIGPSEGYWTHEISVIAQKGNESAPAKISPLADMFSPDSAEIQ